jgi:hypothetical protein
LNGGGPLDQAGKPEWLTAWRKAPLPVAKALDRSIDTDPQQHEAASPHMLRAGHRQFKHASKPGRVTVAGKPGDDLAPGTLNSIQKQAGLK